MHVWQLRRSRSVYLYEIAAYVCASRLVLVPPGGVCDSIQAIETLPGCCRGNAPGGRGGRYLYRHAKAQPIDSGGEQPSVLVLAGSIWVSISLSLGSHHIRRLWRDLVPVGTRIHVGERCVAIGCCLRDTDRSFIHQPSPRD